MKCKDDYSYISTRELYILGNAVENTNEGFVTIDQNHKVVLFNRAAQKIFGYTCEEVIGRDLNLILTPQCSSDHRKAVKNYLENKRHTAISHTKEMVITRKNGEKVPVSISFSNFEYDNITYFTAVVTDLTEIKKLRERMLRAEQLAVLGKIVAEIIHEIKNPLMIIGGFARQLLRKYKDEKDQKKLNIIINEIKRLEELLQTIRGHYAPPTMEYGKVDLNALLKELFSLIKENCKEKGIKTRLNLMEKHVFVKSDEAKLKQVLLNLIKNAVESMDKDGTLEVSVRIVQGQAEISVSDTGSGIPEDIREHIFDPFFTTKPDGTGLGLGICKQIIENHEGGSLTFESEENKGTTFQVRLPLYVEEDKGPIDHQ